jgi:hypothetical protein
LPPIGPDLSPSVYPSAVPNRAIRLRDVVRHRFACLEGPPESPPLASPTGAGPSGATARISRVIPPTARRLWFGDLLVTYNTKGPDFSEPSMPKFDLIGRDGEIRTRAPLNPVQGDMMLRRLEVELAIAYGLSMVRRTRRVLSRRASRGSRRFPTVTSTCRPRSMSCARTIPISSACKKWIGYGRGVRIRTSLPCSRPVWA